TQQRSQSKTATVCFFEVAIQCSCRGRDRCENVALCELMPSPRRNVSSRSGYGVPQRCIPAASIGIPLPHPFHERSEFVLNPRCAKGRVPLLPLQTYPGEI